MSLTKIEIGIAGALICAVCWLLFVMISILLDPLERSSCLCALGEQGCEERLFENANGRTARCAFRDGEKNGCCVVRRQL